MMNKDKEVDVKCMCLSFALNTCPPHSDPHIVMAIAGQYLQFVTGAKPNLRVVANDDKGIV